MRDWVANVADTLLPAGIGAGAAPLPADGPRVPVGDRQRGARPVPRVDRPPARHDRGLRRRRQQRHGHVRRVRRRRRGAADRRRSRRPRHPARTARGPLLRRELRGTPRHAQLRAAGRGRQHRAHALDLRRAGLCRGRARARLAARLGARRIHLRVGDDEALEAFQRLARERGHPARARVGARRRLRLPPGADDGARPGAAREPVGARRQGRHQHPRRALAQGAR